FIFWCKWVVSYIYIELYRRSTKRRFDVYDLDEDHDPVKATFLPPRIESDIESPLPESQLLHSADEVFFYGVNSKSEYLIARISRGLNGEAEAWIYLKLSNGNVYQLQETSGFQKSGSDKNIFTCGGLQINYLYPMKRWRIFFNGLLRETCDNDVTTNKMVHVKFAVLWIASSDIYDFASDVNSRALALGLAGSKWSHYLPPLEKLYSAMNFYVQTGIITGTIDVEGNDEEQNVYLFGEKVRFLGDASSVKGTDFLHVLGHISKNGRFVHVIKVSIANIVEKLIFGFACSLIGDMKSITDTKSVLKNLSDKDKDENDIEAIFHADDEKFVLKGTLTGKQRIFQSNKGWDGSLTIDCLNFELNSLKGRGLVINGKITKPSKRVMSNAPLYHTTSVIPLVVHFSEKVCQNPDVTGGKGSSLGKLSELSKEFQNFVVPNGVVATTSAYELFISNEILEEIKKLEVVLYSDKVEETKLTCQKVVDKITNSPFPDSVHKAIVSSLKKAFPNKKRDVKFAVRSSATGEDTEQMSAAGQMDTYLGVSGTEEIMTAVKKCWASQFAYIAVQYKRQNGQIINSPMAVVIQQMISSDVAGVLFTCDPLTGNPSVMSITANYGLGESVVSGAEEPDSIEIGRQGEDLIIKNKTIGSKSRRIVMKNDGGTDFEEVSDNEKQACCLTDSMILRLAHLAVKIEKSYGSHRDIEWGFWNNNLYIFQSRPVTSGAGETDHEIEHEFDIPLRIEDEYFTVHNVGEVMPGATSPLSLELISKFFNLGFHRYFFFLDWQKCKRPVYFCRGHGFLWLHGVFYAADNVTDDDASAQANAISVFGRKLEDRELFDIARERYSSKKMNKQIPLKEHLKRFYRMIHGSNSELRRVTKGYKGYCVPTDKCTKSHEIFSQLMYCCTDLTDAFGVHMVCSESTSLWNGVIFSILQNAIGEVNADVYSDFARLITTPSGVESADAPSAIESLAYYIYKEVKPEDFKSMTPDDALQWLETSPSKAGRKYREFLQKHGHRSLREFDVRSLSWESDRKTLIQFLQNIIGSVKSDRKGKEDDNFQKLVAGLKAPLSFKDKLLLRIVLPFSRRGVEDREKSKNVLIKALNEWRKGYRKLAKMMVSEGRIPDEDILFFMNLVEIQELLKTRSPKIISKANHRRRRYPVLNKYIFPELAKGYPKPVNINPKIEISDADNFSMKGIPVSQGVAKGTVRVALDLKEASLLQPGEILVTYCTDIGWSPYFPILGGVVTELGGLISHGAVVSREYGLPCIAGLHGATLHFKTGDYALLDGNKGILQRLSKPEDS
ncbi:putative phosphoenolpyruvate synthase, partial [Trichonephila clavata]